MIAFAKFLVARCRQLCVGFGLVWVACMAQAQAHDEGADLGASLKVRSQNPFVIEVSIQPTSEFATIQVETPNIEASTKTPCVFTKPAVGQRQACTLSGHLSAQHNGLVVNVVGFTHTVPTTAYGAIRRRTFTVPNPNWNQADHQAVQERAMTQKGRATTTSR